MPRKAHSHNRAYERNDSAITPTEYGGLQPSSTGMVGGKETGQRMLDYIIPDGEFAEAFANLAATGWKLNLQSAHRRPGTKAPSSKTKFSCPSCNQNAWGKPDLAITCTPCGCGMLAERVVVEAVPAPSYDQEPEAVPVIDAPSYEPMPDAAPLKPKRGRPKGSKNKPKLEAIQSYEQPTERKRRRLAVTQP